MTPTERAQQDAHNNAVLDREARDEGTREPLNVALARIAKTKRTKGASNG